MTDKSQDWVVCDGGPHLLLPTELVPIWEGVREPSSGRVVHARFRSSRNKSAPATDYDLACDVEGELGIIPVGAGFGLVIGLAVPSSTWIPLTQHCGGFVVVPMYWSSATAYRDGRADVAMTEFVENDFVTTEFVMTTQSGSFTLFAACDSGPGWIYSKVAISLAAGTYSVSKANYVAADYEARVYRLLPILQ
jgi:hypothetical protein